MPDQNRSASRPRRTTAWLMGATAVLTIAALAVGISDNPPGIALLYAAGLTLVLSVTHRWSGSKNFARLLLGAVIGFFLLVAIHNFAEVGAERIPQVPLIPLVLTAISVVAFLAAVIVCPMAGLVGAVGWVANLRRGSGEGTP